MQSLVETFLAIIFRFENLWKSPNCFEENVGCKWENQKQMSVNEVGGIQLVLLCVPRHARCCN